MVVSEIGAMLSPKMEPLIMAPHINPTSIPKLCASGTNTGATAAMAPVEVPQEVEINMQTINPTNGRNPTFKSNVETTRIKELINPL